MYNDNITSITLPDSVTIISGYAFDACENLKSIYIPNSVSEIGYSAFSHCNNLESITIPGSVKIINSLTFEGCRNLTNVIIQDGVEEIGYCAFNSCSSLTSITLPNSVNKIGIYAFLDCVNLKSATIAGDTQIGAFMDCVNLTDVKILNGAKSIGDLTFQGCEKLTNIDIADSVTDIGFCTFWDCLSLTNIQLPPNLVNLKSIFQGCGNLEKIVIPKGVKVIESSIFYYSSKITIFGTTGSVAESYAKLENIPFVAIANCIVVYDYDSGEPIPGAEVIISDVNYTTDSEGSVEVDPGKLETLIIKEEGYKNFSTTEFTIDTLELYPIGIIPTDVFDSNAYIEKVILQGTGKHVAFSSNIMNEEVSYLSNTTEKCNLTIGAYLGDKVVSKYIITNNGSIILENTTGKFLNVNMSMFKPGTQTFSYIEFTDGTRCKKVELFVRNHEFIR